jgi:uncharacterized protein (DUF885 family)
MASAEPLPHFVDDYLAYLHETEPTNATLDGVHVHDDLLEDLARPAIEARARSLAGFARRLTEIDSAGLTEVEKIDQRVLASTVRGRMFELEDVRTWERNPQIYADVLSSSLAAQSIFDYAPESERARRVLSKLRQAPRLMQAARDNVKDPPGILVKVSLETLRGTLTFIEKDLPRAFSSIDDLHLLGDLADASTEAAQAVGAYVEYLENEVAPRARSSFRLGRERFEQKLKLEEGIDLDIDRLLAIAMRELHQTQEEFKTAAGRLNGGDPIESWRRIKEKHPSPGGLITVAQEQIDELARFLERQRIITVPAGEPIVVAPSPDFYRWSFASMWTPGPFEPKPTRAYYYLTDALPSWTPDRQEEYLRDFNYPALLSISIHEVYPGHFLHYQRLRQVESKVRKSIMFAPASFVEGWAHYCEHMMVEAGCGGREPSVRVGQLAEALIRLVRVVVGIRLHAEDLSVEQGMRFFRDEAFMEEASARREAERGTFDPSYVVYSLGKLMLLKLRQDWKQAQGSRYSLRDFHDTLLGLGTAPFWVHRRQMLGENSGAVLE